MHSDPKHVTTLIVDDQLEATVSDIGREIHYRKCLDLINAALVGKWYLEPYFCKSLSDVARLEIAPGQPMLAILDMVLDSDDWVERSVQRLDKRIIAEKWPMILVSAKFGSSNAIDRANTLVSEAGAAGVPFQLLPWSVLMRLADGYKSDAEDVAYIFDSVLSRSRAVDVKFHKGLNEPIEILHITDPHFGKAEWDVSRLMELRTVRFKSGLESEADFLAISGDVADRGTPKQYQLAYAYFQALANTKILAKTEAGLPRDRVFLCPGNHDFSRKIALGANLHETTDHRYTVSADVDPEGEWIRPYGWIPYEEFEQLITAHSTRWIEEPGYRINKRFINAGMVVLELNVERFSIDGFQAGISEKKIRAALDSALLSLQKICESNECIVVVAHRHEFDGWDELGVHVSNFFRALGPLGPVILLCGHEHTEKIAAEVDEKVLFIRGLPSVRGPKTPENVLPMTHCVRLLREDGRVCGAEVHQFHQGAENWMVKAGVKPKAFNYTEGVWQIAPRR